MVTNHSPKDRTIEVCFSPALIDLFDTTDTIIVVIDVLRATSSICVAFEYGAKCIVPVATTAEALSYRSKGYLVGAERNGEMLEGFDMGNSPFSFMDEKIAGQSIALTTTNGTQAITAAKTRAPQVVIGSFLNLNALCDWLVAQDHNVLCLCSGWKNAFNLEDSLLAGAIVERLISEFSFSSNCDSAMASQHLYNISKKDIFGFLANSSHRKRLERLHIEKDVEYCLTPNQLNIIPVLKGDTLYNMAVLEEAATTK